MQNLPELIKIKKGKVRAEQMTEKKKLTIRDIARMANVSRSTVSLAINDSPRINDETKARIQKLMDDVGYSPNAMARGLVSDASGVLSVVVPPVGHVFSDSYFSESLSGILDVAEGSNMRVAIEKATTKFRSGDSALKLFRERRIDGLLAVGALTTDTYLRDLAERGLPIVLVNTQMDGVPSVLADNVEGTVSVVHHLASLKHSAIGYIRGLDITTTGMQRDEGFLRGLRLMGLPYKPELVAQGDFSEESGYQAINIFADRKVMPRAIFAANDMMAIGALRRLKEIGYLVGEDVALVGGDDAPLAKYVDPPLTTLRQSMYELGAAAARMLLAWLDSGERPETNPILHTELIVRKSCGVQAALRP